MNHDSSMPSSIANLIRRNDSFVLTTHISPDGDALGSELALALFLRRIGKRVSVINADVPPYNLGWLPAIDTVQHFDGSLRQLKQINGADVIIVLDTNAHHRIGRMSSAVENSSAVKALVDHHTHPETWFDVTFVRESASSTAELVYEIIGQWDGNGIDADIATLLYAGIMTDTGSFRFGSVTPEVHRIVADILERGDIRPAPIHTSIYDTRSRAGIRLLARALESITLMYDDEVGYMVLSQRMMRETGASKDETDGFVNYILSIETVRAGAIFSETDRGIKISFRSKADCYVHEWARHFGGGGHRNASGAFVKGSLDEVIDDVMAAAPRFLDLGDDDAASEDLSDDDRAYLDTLLANRS